MSELIEIDNLPKLLENDIQQRQNENFGKIVKSIKRSNFFEKYRILNKISNIPLIKNALKIEKGFNAIIPDDLKKGLKDGTLKIMQSEDGSVISTIVKSNGGEIVHQIRLEEFTKLANPELLSIAMNQMCMQMQLDEMQKIMVDFRLEANAKLDELIKRNHDDRIAKADAAKLEFSRYQQKEIGKEQLLGKIDEAIPCLLKEINGDLSSLQNYKAEKDDEFQTKILFVIEALCALHDMFCIETYIYRDDAKKCCEISDKYSKQLQACLSADSIKMLHDYSDYDRLGVKVNFWEDSFSNMMKRIQEKNKDAQKFLEGVKNGRV